MLYLLLTAVSLLTGYLGYRRGPVPIFVASVIGMAASLGVTDILIVGILRLYIFRPYMAPTASQDNPLGFLLSDFTAVPLLYSASFVLFPRSRVLTSFVLTALLAGIELGFMHLGVFIHVAWSLWYSMPLFILRFLVAAWWLTHFERVGYTPVIRGFITWLSVNFAWTAWMVSISSIARVWIIRPNLLTNPDSDRVLGALLYHAMPFILTGFLAVLLGWCRSTRGVLLTAGLLTSYLLLLDSSGLWRRGGWHPVLEGAVLTMLVVGVTYLDHWFTTHHPARVRTG